MSSTGMVIKNLKTNNLINPLGIDCANPSFSWNVEDFGTRGQRQTAYRITVALSRESLKNKEFVWDSGKVISDETVNVDYAGEKLKSSTVYYWQVQSFDKDGVAVTSDISWFETGLMDAGWSGAKWIAKTDAILDGYFNLKKFTIDINFKLASKAFSFVFGAKNNGDFYVWQVSDKYKSETATSFVAYQSINGSWCSYLSKPVSEEFAWDKNDFVNMTIDVDNGVVKTYFDGKLFDIQTREVFELGYIGFRKLYDEKFILNNITVREENGRVVYCEDFSDEMAVGFPECVKPKNGCADFANGASLGLVLRYGEKKESAPMFRKGFSTPACKEIAKARLYFTAAGIYRVYINGKDVTDSYLNPGMTAYDNHIMYQTYDVTNIICNGENAIGVYLGHGWWNKALRDFGPRLHVYGKLLIEYKDGSKDIIVTDETWKFYRFGPVIDDDIFNGFKFNGIIEEELSGWNKADFEDSGWEAVKTTEANAIVSNGQTPKVVAQNIPLIRNTITLDAIKMTEPKKGVYVYDFGQNIAGVVKITATEPRGTKIKLRHAEVLNIENMKGSDDVAGMIFTKNLPRAEATDVYVCKGCTAGETFEPFFTYHGFRYLEITGIDNPLPLEDVKALLIMSDLEQTSSFECSNNLVNKLYLNALWSARDNFLSVPTDCPQRGERFGWTGDAQIFTRTGSYMMDVNALYQKYCMDMRDTSTNNRIIADVAPASVGNGWYGQGARKGATNGFGDAIVIIPYQIYKQYGNKRILEENYETMCNWMDYLLSTSTDFIRDESWTGDWMAVNEPKTPVAVTDTAYCAYSAYLIAEIARVLGKNEDVKTYTNIYNNYKDAWRANFLEEDGCTTKCGTQTSYVLGIKFNLFNEDEKSGAAKNLVKNIESWNWHLTTGFLGLSFLNPVLSDTGHTDVAYRLLKQTEHPSWLYSVMNGATSIWESWNVIRELSDGTKEINAESQNHFSYGSVAEWLFRYVLGIDRDDENSNSFKHFLLKPELGGGFTHANGCYNSVRGTIKSGWKLDDDKQELTFAVTVPANTTATLYLPVKDESTVVLEGGITANESVGVLFIGFEKGRAIYRLQSGVYEFKTGV